jgi:DNA-binding LytR/AlgR family response regulator
MISFIIVDDEPIAHRIIQSYAADLPNMEFKGNCYNALEALDFLNKESVDLMFLDINMPKLKGFDFLRTLSKPPKVIVTTAYKEFALEGYELDICDYLLKPFGFPRFVKAVNKVIQQEAPKVNIINKTEVESSNQSLFIKGDKKYHQINLNDILVIEAYGNYTKIIRSQGMIISNEKISSFEEMLPEAQFLRVHKSFIVAKDKIEVIEGNRINIAQLTIPIGQLYKRQVKAIIK